MKSKYEMERGILFSFHSRYRQSLDVEDTIIVWEEGPLVYVCWKFVANISSAEPRSKGTFVLESLLLPRNRPHEALPTA